MGTPERHHAGNGGGAATANAAWVGEKERSNRWLLRLMRTLALGVGRRLSRLLLHPITLYFLLTGPNVRRVSNRIFNDINVNVFSERGVTQFGTAWGQFLDHTFGLRQENGTTANIPFNAADPLESFRNDLGVVPFVRSAAAPGTGVNNARQHVNTVSSFIDAWAVYGGTDTRLDFLREGSQDGNPDNNGARLFLPGNYLPRRNSRGNAATAPAMAVDGRLLSHPNDAAVAGDVRANENAALTAMHTLFAREHNRIVAALPSFLSQQDRFQLARAVVIAEQQFITYNEFLPAMGVSLPAYRGYDSGLNPALAHEFATTGYRAHSQLHGELETETNVSRYSQATLDALEAQGVEVTVDGDDVELAVPLGVMFFNPSLVQQIQLGPLLKGLASESEYRNDELIDNQLRSVLFQVPISSNPDCLDGPTLPQCFNGVVDLAANVLTSGGGADYMVGGGGNDTFVLTNAPGVATVGDYAAGDVVDIGQFLSVAGATNVVAGGYVRIVGTQLQVDATGGGDAFVTIGNVSGSGNVTIRYQSGGSPTDLSVARSAGQEAQSEAIVAETALDDGPAHAALLDGWHAGSALHDTPGLDPIAPHFEMHGII